jgi:hypothetical protein
LNPLIPQPTERIDFDATMKLPISVAVTTTQSRPFSRTPLKSIYEGSKSLRKQNTGSGMKNRKQKTFF